jgi:hypothetical protein
LLDLLEENGADVNLFWSLVQYTVFAVQARYETGLVETETPIDRVAVIEAVQQLLDTVLAETGLNVAQVRNHRI